MNTEINAALEEIRLKDPTGVLRPEAVVDAAKAVDHLLHSKFTWDDTEAAQKYRLDQARRIIRVSVTVLQEDNEPVRAYVSLSNERPNGYRLTKNVLSEEALRKQMFEDALNELRAFRRKYARLTELASLWATLDTMEKPEAAAKAG